jgi:hypothetical protein
MIVLMVDLVVKQCHWWVQHGHSTKMSFYSWILYAKFFDCGCSSRFCCLNDKEEKKFAIKLFRKNIASSVDSYDMCTCFVLQVQPRPQLQKSIDWILEPGGRVKNFMSRHQPTDVISVCYVYFAKLF